MATKTNDADVLKYFNDLQDKKMLKRGGSMLEGAEEPAKEKRTYPKFHDSKMYAGHVARVLKRNKKKRERRERGPQPLFKTPEGYQRQYKRGENKRKRKKKVHNWLASGKQRRQERKAKRSDQGEGGGWTCTPESC
tara:strand:+ start:493 stop:900 length:408 start_codon:yes stop_codon:yes gene_type:complete